MSILSSMRYCLGPPDAYGPIWAALAFMPFGLFFDFMDGKVARWRGKSSLMGQELDSLADLVCQANLNPELHCGVWAHSGRLVDSVVTPFGTKKPVIRKARLTPPLPIDLLRRRPRRLRLRPRPPQPPGHAPPLLFRPLRPHPPRPLQRHRLLPP